MSDTTNSTMRKPEAYSPHIRKAQRRLPQAREIAERGGLTIVEVPFLAVVDGRQRLSVTWRFTTQTGRCVMIFWPGCGKYRTVDGRVDLANPRRAAEIAVQTVNRLEMNQTPTTEPNATNAPRN